jgi:probable phosphoglycerate mutase
MASTKNTEIVLLRHAHSTANLKGILAGRDNKIGLSPRGKREAEDLVTVLSAYTFDAIYTSPLKRCLETIAPYLKASGKSSIVEENIVEMEYGEWSGKPLVKLARLKLWASIQSRPSTVRFPGGESFSEMSLRANQAIIDRSAGAERILVVSHGDVIKSVVAFHLGLPLDSFQRISIDPASISTIRYPSSHVTSVNVTSHLSRGEKSGHKRDRFSLGGGSGRI